MRVIWDDAKNRTNRKKHGVSFEEANVLFTGDDYQEIFDDVHSDEEDRFISIGPIVRGTVLVVYTERDEEMAIVMTIYPPPDESARLEPPTP